MRRERITITIDSNLLPAVDELIDGISVRNRSHALEVAVKRGLQLHTVTSLIISLDADDVLNIALLDQYVAQFPISTVCLIAPQSQLGEQLTLSTTLSKHRPVTVTTLPADFGDAAALQLALPTLTGHSLLVLGDAEPVPAAVLVPALVAHVQRGHTATQLIRPTGTRTHIGNVSILSCALLAPHLTGQKRMKDDVFPHLAKLGTLNVYAY
jgi:hypothetical protein